MAAPVRFPSDGIVRPPSVVQMCRTRPTWAMKLIRLALNGPKSRSEQMLVDKLIDEHNAVVEREELRQRLGPKINELVQESMAYEVLGLLAESDVEDVSDRIRQRDFNLTTVVAPAAATSAQVNCVPVVENAAAAADLSEVIKQERLSPVFSPPQPQPPPPPPPPPPVSVGDQGAQVPAVAASASAVAEPSPALAERPPPNVPSQFAYMQTSNRLLELTIENEEIKGQLQVIDGQIAKCLQMRIALLSRQQALDTERVALLSEATGSTVSTTMSMPTSIVTSNPAVQENGDCRSSFLNGIDLSNLQKYILPSTTTTTTTMVENATTRIRKPKTAGASKLKAVIGKKKTAKKSTAKKSKATDAAKRKRPTKETDNATSLSQPETNSTVVVPEVVVVVPDESQATAKLPPPTPSFFKLQSQPSDAVIPVNGRSVVDVQTPVVVSEQYTVSLLKNSSVQTPVAGERRTIIEQPAGGTASPSRTSLPPPPQRPPTSDSAPSIIANRGISKQTDNSTRTATKRKTPLIELDNVSKRVNNGHQKTDADCSVVQSSRFSLEGIPRRLHLGVFKGAVASIKIFHNRMLAYSREGIIREFMEPFDKENVVNSHEYVISSSSEVVGFEVLSLKTATLIIVALKCGSLKKFLANDRYPLKTVPVRAMLTCMTLRWNTLFLGTSEGKVLRYCPVSFRLHGSLPCTSLPITCLGTAMEGACRMLVSGSEDGDLSIRDAVSGLFSRWLKLRLNRHPRSLYVVNNRVCTLAAMGGGIACEIYIHDVQTGNLLHVVENSRGITALYASVEDLYNVYFTTTDGSVYKYSSNGRQPAPLELKLADGTTSQFPDSTSLIVISNMIFVGSNRGQLEALLYNKK